MLPQYEEIKKIRGKELCLKMLMQLAQMSPHCGQLKNPTKYVQIVFDVLKVSIKHFTFLFL